MLIDYFYPVNAPSYTGCDIGWLRKYEVRDMSEIANIAVAVVYRFLYIPKNPFTDKMTTGRNIVDDLRYAGNFNSTKNP